MSGTSLKSAVHAAIVQGRDELTRLDELADQLADGLASTRPTDMVPSPALDRLDDLCRELTRGLRRHLDHERDALGTFNIAFFGRTGAGKSTLLSAFGELDGEYVSPGASDWTTDIHHVEWHDCRLFDTPGINGWGRTQSRDELEAKARKAIEIADVIVLCFDSQSQQAMEFAKIAAWIQEYGKPAIAVLNVRNVRWRHPSKVPEDRRSHLSASVRQHADNIGTELAQIGLRETPIVAVQNRRALFARATTPFHGPALEDFTRERDEFGIDYLTRWSNFETLADLMSAMISEGGGELRLAALREDIRARCTTSAADLTLASDEFLAEAVAREQEAEALFSAIGYPSETERASLLGDKVDVDWVTRSETERGSPYTASPIGSLDRFTQHQTASHLAGPLRACRKKADALIADAFDNNTVIDEDTFRAKVFDDGVLTDAVEVVWKTRCEFLQRELDVTAAQAPPAAKAALLDAAAILGSKGTNAAGQVMRGAGVAAGAAAAAVPIAIANFWNPGGWVLGVAAAGVGIAGQVQQWYGKKKDNAAQQQAQANRAQAIADAHRAVHQTASAYEELIIQSSRESAWQLVGPILLDALRDSVALRQASRRAKEVAHTIQTQAATISTAHAVEDVLRRAQAQIASTPGELTQTLLGEDWISGQSPYTHTVADALASQEYADQQQHATANLAQGVAQAWSVPPPDAVRRWRDELEDAAHLDAGLLPSVQTFRRVSRGRPTFTVLGDYNSGKSSLIRRILVDSGEEAGMIDIRARPSTSQQMRYEFPRFDLVDTPGLQSGNVDHDQIAFESITESALVFVVVHVNLLIGNTELLEEIANGSNSVAAKGHKMIFLINRADELGIDPHMSPGAYINLQDRKVDELIAALATKSIVLDRERVHCLAADPFGMLGATVNATTSDFDANRDWDGVGPLVAAISGLTDEQISASSLTAAFDSALASLKQLRRKLETDRHERSLQIDRVSSLLAIVRTAQADCELLQKGITESARRIVASASARAAGDIHGTPQDNASDLVRIVNSWTSDPRLTTELDQFADATAKELDGWHTEHSSLISREYQASGLTVAPTTATFTPQTGSLSDDAIQGAGRLADGAGVMAKAIGNRNAVYAIGKQFGHKFKPWGAVKGGARFAKAGAVLGVVAAAVDAKGMVDDSKKAKTHKENQQNAEAAIEQAAESLVDDLTIGDGTGPVGHLDDIKSDLVGMIGENTQILTSVETELAALDDQIRTVEQLIESANLQITHREG